MLQVRKALSILLVLMMAVGCVGMAQAESAQVEKLRVGVGSILPTMDPCYAVGIAQMAVYYNVFDLLLEYDPTAADGVRGVLAESWKQVDDVTWDITLRQGVTFQNGEACTAEDHRHHLRLRDGHVPGHADLRDRHYRMVRLCKADQGADPSAEKRQLY